MEPTQRAEQGCPHQLGFLFAERLLERLDGAVGADGAEHLGDTRADILLAIRKEGQQALLDSINAEQQRAGRLVDGFLG